MTAPCAGRHLVAQRTLYLLQATARRFMDMYTVVVFFEFEIRTQKVCSYTHT